MIELNVLDNTAVAMEVSENDIVDLLVDMSVVGGGGIIPSGTKSISITANGTYTEDVTTYASAEIEVDVEGQTINNQNKSVTPSESVQSVTADVGYTGLGTVTVGAIDSEYVGSDVPRNDSSDLTASGATVSVPSGYYESSASKSVASGSEGTPTASKGAVSNHSVSVTPSVTNGAGYIAGGTHSGTAVVVSASELVSGTKSITDNGTHDVTDYASVDVDVQGGGGYTAQDILMGDAPSGEVTIYPDKTVPSGVVSGRQNITKLTFDFSGTNYWFSGANNVNSNTFMHNNIPIYHIVGGTGVKNVPAYLFTNNTSEFIVICRGGVGFGYIGQSGFRLNTGLKALDYTYVANQFGLRANVFYGDSKFDTLIIRSDSVMPLENVSAFSNATQFRNGGTGGTLYVPQALISSYQSATNWSTILGYANNSIQAIEGSQYENYYADGTPIT